MEEKDKDGVIQETENTRRLIYTVDENPPIHLCVLFGLQQSMLSLSKSLTVCILVAELVCSDKDEHLKTQLFSSTMVMSGVCTFLQCTIGIGLPLYQGPSASYVVPLLALASLKEWQCPSIESIVGSQNITSVNTTDMVTQIYRDEVILPKIQKLSGSLLLAGAIHTCIGLTGMVGALLSYIGPLTVVPAITLIGIYMVKAVVKFISSHWGVGLLTTSIALILSLYLGKLNTLIPWWNRKQGLHIKRYPLHKVFSIMIAVAVGWIISFILTEVGYFTSDKTSPQYMARTDARIYVVHQIDWFSFPYPGQFGAPTFTVGVFVSFLIATLLSVIDSIGDYYACAKVCDAPTPPSHAVNRGIFVEGVASTLSGALGIGHSTSTIGGNIGAIGVTRVASRRVFQMVGIIYIIFGIIGKIGAFFISIPYCVLGGVQVVNFGILIGVVLSNLSHIDLNSSRNLCILGVSLLVGLMIPHWTKLNPDAVPTGNEQADSIIRSLLSNPAIIGGGVACFLDNTCPGSRKERGLVGWQVDLEEGEDEHQKKTKGESVSDSSDDVHIVSSDIQNVYTLSFLPASWRRSRLFRKLPILPGYRPSRLGLLQKCRKGD